MSALDIITRGGEFFVSSETIADGSGVQHKNVLELVDANRADLEDFGQVAFETRPGYNNARIRVALLNEQQATLLMTFQRNTDQVRAFKKVLVKAFFEMSRGAAPVAEVSRRDLALAVLAAEDEADRQRARAEAAESFKHAIESNNGLSPREFHKHYFADTPERVFFETLYSRHLLIDQRRKGTRRTDGTYRDGAQHGHPTAEGKRYFYLDAGIDERTGYRYEQARVRPGDPELALVATLARRGLMPTRAITTEITNV